MIKEAEVSPRDYALALFLADTGCRVAGVVGLKFGDLDLEHGTAEVFEKGRGGNKKARLVFFVKRLGELWRIGWKSGQLHRDVKMCF